MALFTRVKTWVSNEVLTASELNGEFDNILTNSKAASQVGYSADVAEMRTVADPGAVSSESLASNISGEIARLRFAIKRIVGGAQWYSTPDFDLTGTLGTSNIADNAITTAKLLDGLLTADATGRAKMADGFVNAAKIASGVLSNATYVSVTADGSVVVPANKGVGFIEGIGGGGGGGGGGQNTSGQPQNGGGGGSSGVWAKVMVSLTAGGETLTVDIGAGGTAGTGAASGAGSNGGTGASTTVAGSFGTVTFLGGLGGTCGAYLSASGGVKGAQQLVAGGGISAPGGDGGSGVTTSGNAGSASLFAAGGAAGTGGPGGSGGGGGGAGRAAGGAGGNGNPSAGATGAANSGSGGGGGGASTSGAATNGGVGGTGHAGITYFA